jgi:hypothetical protein
MDGIVICLGRSAKRRIARKLREIDDAGLATRYLIVLNLDEGRSPTEIARILHVSRTTVYRVAWRFRECGEAGLIDRREDSRCGFLFYPNLPIECIRGRNVAN